MMRTDIASTARGSVCTTAAVLVVTHPACFEECVTRLEAEPDIDVHHSDAATGRIIVVVEARDVADLTRQLERMRTLPDVMLAEPVYVRRDESLDDDASTPDSGGGST